VNKIFSLNARINQILLQARKISDMDPEIRIMKDEEEIQTFLEHAKHKGMSIVLTQGTFDLIHIGHARYLRKAKEYGDLLIVGVDDDEKTRGRKGENRPVVPLTERIEMLGHLSHVDVMVVKHASHPRWHLIKLIRPDVLIAVDGTYNPEDIVELEKMCNEVVVLPRQAQTSTSSKVRTLVLDGADNLKRILKEKIPEFVEAVYHELKKDN
jgi:D-beta-D-heptose 7-phosphate kinase/D-beta-D-heptose 1-phosphate adenosyltransferase